MGIFDKIKKVLGAREEATGLTAALLAEVKKEDRWIDNQLITAQPAWKKIAALSDSERVSLLISILPIRIANNQSKRPDYSLTHLFGNLSSLLIRSLKTITDAEVLSLTNGFIEHCYDEHPTFHYWPIEVYVNHLKKLLKDREISDQVRSSIERLAADTRQWSGKYYEKERTKILSAIETMLFTSDHPDAVMPELFPASDDVLAKHANPQLQLLSGTEKDQWFAVMAHAKKTSGARPSNKFAKDGEKLVAVLSSEKYLHTLNDWIVFAKNVKDADASGPYEPGYYPISSVNIDVLKGLLWLSVPVADPETIRNVGALAERCFRKIPGRGPAATALGNACLYVLANSSGLDGVAQLSRLKLRIRQSSTQGQINAYLIAAAKAQNMTVDAIEDLAVDSFGLEEGKSTWQLGDFSAEVEITAVGKTETRWLKKDGSLQKSVPASVKENFADELKEIKDTAKQSETTTSVQRDRIDRMFRNNRKMDFDHFQTYYFHHGLMGFLTRKIIWNFETDAKKQSGIWHQGDWITISGEKFTPSENATVSLWHPALASVEETRNWRRFLMENEISQPLKQAFREVYLLTEAELRTRTYSNRMAAHVLKQHQFNSLAKIRGWKYSLMGAFDDGRDNGTAEITLPDYGLRAEFWINEINADDAYNDTGIWNYVATDQVRFVNTSSGEPIELIEVPPLLFSEILRDVDLFVGVASVGNDPDWQDNGGLPVYRDYWQSYSFGDLSEVAKTRKELLSGLIPRLKIREVAEIRDKFLVVKGKIRTYKIHIGSTNILMEPNDEYLCIVPDRSGKATTEKVFLPFEGDSGLSVVLSKALLLAEDDKITDTTITSQINRK